MRSLPLRIDFKSLEYIDCPSSPTPTRFWETLTQHYSLAFPQAFKFTKVSAISTPKQRLLFCRKSRTCWQARGPPVSLAFVFYHFQANHGLCDHLYTVTDWAFSWRCFGSTGLSVFYLESSSKHCDQCDDLWYATGRKRSLRNLL